MREHISGPKRYHSHDRPAREGNGCAAVVGLFGLAVLALAGLMGVVWAAVKVAKLAWEG